MIAFQANDPSLDSQWRSIILFGKNSATYKFAFAQTLLELVNQQTTSLSLKDLSEPFLRNILEHLKNNVIFKDPTSRRPSSKKFFFCELNSLSVFKHSSSTRITSDL